MSELERTVRRNLSSLQRAAAGVTRTLRAVQRVRDLDADRLARIAFGVLCLGFAIGIIVFPTYPNYDSYYSLLWGREVLDLGLPVFEGFRIPTEHPLAIAAGALLSLFGEAGDRLWVGMTFGAFLALVAGVYRLGRIAFTPVVGAIAAALLLSRFDFAFLAARGYIDIPYMALVVWALVLEVQRPKRGTIVFALLAAAGLLRVEGWLLAAAYWVWMSYSASWRERFVWALWAAVGPVGWMLVDYTVTGDPLFSITYTSGFAEDLGRSRSLTELPAILPTFFANLVKLPVLIVAIAGVVLAIWLSPRRSLGPLLLFGLGLGTFVAISAGGASVIERYLVIAALALLIFAAVGFGGWSMLEPGTRLRRWWAGLALLAVLGGVAYTATNLNLRRFENELTFRGDAHDALSRVLKDPKVTAALRCGPLTLPNHKLVPDARWILDQPYETVRARAEWYVPDDAPPLADGTKRKPLPRADGGVEIFATSRMAIFKHAWTSDSDPASIQTPRDGWTPVARSDHYAAYARC